MENTHIVESLRPLAVELGSLKHDPKNARIHGDRNLEAIRFSLHKFGQRKPIVALDDGTVIAGNGTLEAAKVLGWPSLAVVRVKDDPATAAAYAIADNRTAELASWDSAQLAETMQWLEDQELDFEVHNIGFSPDEVEELLAMSEAATKSDEVGEDIYTKKIIIPVYEPTGPKPALSACINLDKTEQLISEIKSAPDLTDEDRSLLISAAYRHTVFNYQQVAEYYCHAPKHVQVLMEKSALVIIDLEKAIEQGLVVMSKEIAEVYRNDRGPEETPNA